MVGISSSWNSEPLGHPLVTHWPALPHTGVLFVLYGIVSTLIYDFMPTGLLLFDTWLSSLSYSGCLEYLYLQFLFERMP